MQIVNLSNQTAEELPLGPLWMGSFGLPPAPETETAQKRRFEAEGWERHLTALEREKSRAFVLGMITGMGLAPVVWLAVVVSILYRNYI